MGSRGIYDNNQPTWIPYITNRDCSQGLCSLNCPQFCYFTVPPPPPVDFPEVNSSGPFNFSPLVIAVIGIIASAILLVTYYTLISKYCRNTNTSSRGGAMVSRIDSGRERRFTPSSGLDEAVIQSIAVCKYKKGAGFGSDTEGTCSVCLSEFEEGESVRLLPKCTHPFHVVCIDTWLRSHPSCPLCRADITFPMLTSPPPVVADNGAETPEVSEDQRNIDIVVASDGHEAVIEVRRPIRRSFSTGNYWCQTVADVLREDDVENQIHRDSDAAKWSSETMKRSFSSGRLVRKDKEIIQL